MITTINEFKTSKAKKKKYAAYDLIIVDVQKQYKDYISDQFLIDLNTYCNEFNRVFQIYDTNKKDSPDYIFNNQTKAYGKQYGDKLSIDDVPGYFPLNMQETIKKILTDIPDEGQMFETMYNDYWVYVGAQHDGGHEWFLCNKELANLFKSFAKQQRKIILVGGAGGECIKDIYVTLKAFGVNVEYNFEHIYSKQDKVNEQIINENNRASLYHGLKNEYALKAIDNNKLDAYTFQRFWADGKRRKDDDPEYAKSYYYRGLSLTRDINYAANWNNVIFEFDQNILKTKYKLIPYNWGYSIGGGYKQGANVKREREEFLIVSYVKKVLTNQQIIKMLETPGGAVEPLDKFLSGIYISKRSYDIYTDNDNKIYEPFEKIKQHPKFKGLI